MNKLFDHDITDDEIRIIKSDTKRTVMCKSPNRVNDCDDVGDSGEKGEPLYLYSDARPKADISRRDKGRNRLIIIISIGVTLVAVAVIAIILLTSERDEDNEDIDNIVNREITESTSAKPVIAVEEPAPALGGTDLAAPVERKGSVSMTDTVVGGRGFEILIPHDADASLEIGVQGLNDTTVVMIFQAADTRRDNGGIVGSFVIDGELVSRGKAKAGFCAIIGGEITIGVAENTPLFEKATEEGGYFFRQYPLVVENQVIENKPKNRSLRKALAELNGETVVIISREKMTINEFSQSLADMGVKNAIYLVGSTAYGFARDADGNIREFGTVQPRPASSVNYIVWR